MAFGVVNSAATFNRVMRKVNINMRNIKDVDFYVDDVLGHTEKWQSHMIRLRKLFIRIRGAGLMVRPTKIKGGFHGVDFVVHILSAGYVAMDPGRLGRIHEAPRPQTKK